MRRVLRFSLPVAVTLVVLALTLVGSAYSQQTGGVFVGRGRVARPPARDDRARRDERAPRDDRDSRERVYTDDDLKPMIPDRRLRQIESLEQQCLDEVNRHRERHGLGRLELSDELLEIARDYSRRMAEERFFSHTDPEGRTVRQRVSDAGIRWRVLGENLAYSNGYHNPVAASMNGWMDSEGHRRNILDPSYRQTAIGAWISSDGTVFFTEIFLK
ncbi:MAG TPA: CAP domain-containing protein [Blastocatellia bacterium]|nr:CAP domain-containing protein [Blastocatellia bacterium]